MCVCVCAHVAMHTLPFQKWMQSICKCGHLQSGAIDVCYKSLQTLSTAGPGSSTLLQTAGLRAREKVLLNGEPNYFYDSDQRLCLAP